MEAMRLLRIGAPLRWAELPDPMPGEGEVRLKISACGVCRTDLHVQDGELPGIELPIIPGHEIVGRVERVGRGVTALAVGDRVGVPWLGRTCGCCAYCRSGSENLCDSAQFTGYTRDGGFASHVVVDAQFALKLPQATDDLAVAPLLCAGLIGWRALVAAGDGERLGIYGFGAAGHLIAQVALWQGRQVAAFTRAGDLATQGFAKRCGVQWAGDAAHVPEQALDAAIIFAPAGELVPTALRAVRKGGSVVCAGIHMSDIPGFPYRLLWHERRLVSVANLTRRDGEEFLRVAARAGVRAAVTPYPFREANQALQDLRNGSVQGAAVLDMRA
jgi:propanol-preferring alcohol dehydrogenase